MIKFKLPIIATTLMIALSVPALAACPAPGRLGTAPYAGTMDIWNFEGDVNVGTGHSILTFAPEGTAYRTLNSVSFYRARGTAVEVVIDSGKETVTVDNPLAPNTPLYLYFTYGQPITADKFSQALSSGSSVVYPGPCHLYVWFSNPVPTNSSPSVLPAPNGMWLVTNNGLEMVGSLISPPSNGMGKIRLLKQ